MKSIPITDEKELLTGLKAGDKVAFKQLYEVYSGRLASKLIYLLKSEELAQDILQDVFLKIWTNREMIDIELSFGAFLYKIATNLSKNVIRKNVYDQLMRHQIGQEEVYHPIEEGDDAEEAKAILDQAMGQLTDRQREVYTLHKIEGLSYQEISEKLNISLSAINHHIQKANKQLKAILKSRSFELFICLLPALLKK
ncbi:MULTISPECIES: RNA polymerase sigma factor [Pedobacter]|uniref:RNA polymerase sigma factor n=1 Tax=Pedobacter zeae TaxID=1737356 RepID=A0A7W6KC58_9SPHI|nr:sigma-70 family RNA polymerase sigma factor [Pedobacter zeae]MBB4109098.1 RNA polymerase sigma-70 factor (ECF subfamily) [Pedobacter zeae]GGH10267.1 RNA polymerase sigma-70 factor [Pedobacter zeae]